MTDLYYWYAYCGFTFSVPLFYTPIMYQFQEGPFHSLVGTTKLRNYSQ